MNIVYIFKRILHHSAHSGYDQIVKYVPSESLSSTGRKIIEKILNRIPEKKLRRWTWVGGWYKNESLAKEIQIALNLPFRKAIYHYLYGEDDFHWGGDLPCRSGSKLVVTFHQPPDVFDEVIKDKSYVTKADAIIVCGTNQVAHLEKITGRKNVYFVPHGVDTSFFSPLKVRRKVDRFNTISVGWWLRDVDMIRRIIEKANERSLDIEFNIVTFPQYFDHYKGLRNVNLFSGIPDDELRRKYQEADALLLPMKDCTANNSILEAMACGVPVLTSDNGGIRDYVDEGSACLAKAADDGYLFDALIELTRDPLKKERMGTAARQKALEFDWKNVAKKMMETYEKIWSS